jgi:hypothetical protein
MRAAEERNIPMPRFTIDADELRAIRRDLRRSRAARSGATSRVIQ